MIAAGADDSHGRRRSQRRAKDKRRAGRGAVRSPPWWPDDARRSRGAVLGAPPEIPEALHDGVT
jgi:hypothetical protein